MRLRTIPLLLVVVAIVAAAGAWSDHLKIETTAPPVVAATKPWDAIVKVTRRGRGIDGYHAVVTITGPRGTQQLRAKELGGGVYRFEVKLRGGGFYTYTVLVGDRIAGLGTVYSVPQ
jgi:hypothetical protein